MKRREFLQLGGSLAAVALAPNPLYASAAQGSWAPYDKTLVIDGLGFALELGEVTPDPSLFGVFADSGLTAVQQTVPYPARTTRKPWNKSAGCCR